MAQYRYNQHLQYYQEYHRHHYLSQDSWEYHLRLYQLGYMEQCHYSLHPLMNQECHRHHDRPTGRRIPWCCTKSCHWETHPPDWECHRHQSQSTSRRIRSRYTRSCPTGTDHRDPASRRCRCPACLWGTSFHRSTLQDRSRVAVVCSRCWHHPCRPCHSN